MAVLRRLASARVDDLARVARQVGRARRRGRSPRAAALRYGSASWVQRSSTRAMRAASCGLMRVELEHAVGPERVAGAVGAVERRRVAHAERADQAARAVRVARREVRVAQQLLDALEHARRRARARSPAARTTCRSTSGSSREQLVEALERRRRRASDARRDAAPRSAPWRSVMLDGVLEALVGAAGPDRVAARRRRRGRASRAPGWRARAGPTTPGRASSAPRDLVRLEGPFPVVAQRARELRASSPRAPRGCAAGRPASSCSAT